jgi:hypothetical protein
MTPTNRRRYRRARAICVLNLALAALVLHAAPDGWPLNLAQASIGLCVVIGVVATQQLRQGVEA